MIGDKPGKAFGQLLETFLPQYGQFVSHNLSGGAVLAAECSDVKSVEEWGCFTHAKLYQRGEDFAKTSGRKLVEIGLNLVPFSADPFFDPFLTPFCLLSLRTSKVWKCLDARTTPFAKRLRRLL